VTKNRSKARSKSTLSMRPDPFEVEHELTPELIASQENASAALSARKGQRIHCLTMLIEPFVGRFIPAKNPPGEPENPEP